MKAFSSHKKAEEFLDFAGKYDSRLAKEKCNINPIIYDDKIEYSLTLVFETTPDHMPPINNYDRSARQKDCPYYARDYLSL